MPAVKTRDSCPWGGGWVLVRLDGKEEEIDLQQSNDLPADLAMLMYTVLRQYRYLLV